MDEIQIWVCVSIFGTDVATFAAILQASKSHPHLMLGHLQSLQNHCLKVLLLVLWKERGELIAFVPGKVCLAMKALFKVFGNAFQSKLFSYLWDKTVIFIPWIREES